MKEQVIDNNKGKSKQIDIGILKKAIYSKKDKKMLKIINRIFQHIEPNTLIWGEIKSLIRMKNKTSDTEYKEFYEYLIDLEVDTIEYGIARMKKIEAENDTKTIPYILTIILFIFPYYVAALGLTLNNWFILGLLIFILLWIINIIVRVKAKIQIVIYFRSLLESIKETKKERETANKKTLEEQIEHIEKQQEHIENKQEKIEQRLFLLKKNNK